ncbi:homing endonuclease associated repeat-containing protein [Acidithiobacillus sulfuriphilus]|uniref:HNH endonuclease n=2 Tax=Acidithiobacillus sulfuriphilus TaxID=1867749 RepID=A0ACD5HN03_9PROT|nr:HNH endonuclease [Acidithiobacillus sulfuriphilus]
MKFELSRLTDYSSEAIISELQRVAAIVQAAYLSKALFDEHSRVHSATVVRRFHGWENALTQAGLSQRIQPVNITEKMRNQLGKGFSEPDLILELQRVSALVGVGGLKTQDFNEHSSIDAAIVRRRFGSWNKGLKAAGLAVPARARRYTDEDCFENILNLWMHFGRSPHFREMDVPPSTVGGTAYVKRWGTFNKALLAFIAQTDADIESSVSVPLVEAGSMPPRAEVGVVLRVKRDVPLGVRFTVLKRDRYKCVLCGASPTTDVTCNLHVDHIVSLAQGGGNEITNLRTLCDSCNLGKGARSE